MADLSDYLENELLDHMLGTGAFTAPSGVWIQLHTGAPGEAGTANVASETTRVSAGAFAAASSGTTDNDSAITWSSVSTTETYSHISGWDASTSGNCLFTAALSSSVSVTSGDDFEIAAGDLDVSLA